MADRVDVAVIGSGFGGAITAFRYAAAGLRVLVLERGLRIADADLRQSQAPDDLFRVYTRYQSTFIGGDGDTGLDVLTGTVFGGGLDRLLRRIAAGAVVRVRPHRQPTTSRSGRPTSPEPTSIPTTRRWRPTSRSPSWSGGPTTLTKPGGRCPAAARPGPR